MTRLALDENTWRFGFNRLLLGYALGDEEAMLSDVVPVANVEGSAAQWLGRLCAFIDAMHRIRKELTQARSAQAWKLWLMEWLELLLDTESTDAGERAAVRDLREAIAALGNDAGRWLGDEPIEFAVLRDALEDAIGEPRKARAGRFDLLRHGADAQCAASGGVPARAGCRAVSAQAGGSRIEPDAQAPATR